MSITPLEIRQKSFEKSFRGYEKEAVDAFLLSLSQEWERFLTEKKAVAQRLEEAEKDVQKLREVETSLYRALKTAEDTGANVIDQANKSAELQLKEAQMKADGVINEAKVHARNLIEEAESAVKEINESLRNQIKQFEADFRNIENHRDNLLIELRNLSNDTIARVDKYQNKSFNLEIAPLLEKTEGKVSEFVIEEGKAPEPTPTETPIKEPGEIEFEVNTSFSEEKGEEPKDTSKKDKKKKDKGEEDFFDSI